MYENAQLGMKHMIGFKEFAEARKYQQGSSIMARMLRWTRHSSVGGCVSHLDSVFDLYNEGSIVLRKLELNEEVGVHIWTGYTEESERGTEPLVAIKEEVENGELKSYYFRCFANKDAPMDLAAVYAKSLKQAWEDLPGRHSWIGASRDNCTLLNIEVGTEYERICATGNKYK